MLVKGGIFLNEIFLVLGNIVDGMNRVGGASRNTVRHSRYNPRDPHTSEWRLRNRVRPAGMDAIGRADLDAKGILDAGISDYIGHDESISKRK
jgi:hypothetical protein